MGGQRGGRLFMFRLHEPSEKLDDEKGQRYKKKVDHLPQKQPVWDLLAISVCYATCTNTVLS
jgi:hypothetical protein